MALTIYFEERDRALLLSADLKSYIHSEVLQSGATRAIKLAESRDFFLIFFTIGFAISLLYIWWSTPAAPKFHNANATDAARLRFLVDYAEAHSQLDYVFPAIFAPLFLILVATLVAPLARLLFLPSAFYWGKETTRYDRRKSIRTQIFWVVIVGLIISTIGSLAVAKLSGR